MLLMILCYRRFGVIFINISLADLVLYSFFAVDIVLLKIGTSNIEKKKKKNGPYKFFKLKFLKLFYKSHLVHS